MKKLLLGVLMLSLVGCGGLYKARTTVTVPKKITFAPSAVAVEYHYGDILVDQNQYESPSIDAVNQRVDVNVGGAGSIGFAFTSPGTDCALVTPTEVIPIAALTTTTDTPISLALLTELNNNLLLSGSVVRMCIQVINTDVANPIDIEITATITVSSTTSI